MAGTRVPVYFAVFLRLAKYRAAARIMMAHPPMVKIVVPIPPVEGREESLVFVMFVFKSAVPAPAFDVVTVSICTLDFTRYAASAPVVGMSTASRA